MISENTLKAKLVAEFRKGYYFDLDEVTERIKEQTMTPSINSEVVAIALIEMFRDGYLKVDRWGNEAADVSLHLIVGGPLIPR